VLGLRIRVRVSVIGWTHLHIVGMLSIWPKIPNTNSTDTMGST